MNYPVLARPAKSRRSRVLIAAAGACMAAALILLAL